MSDKKISELPKGFTCECGEHHKFPMYVYAHWRESIVHTCETCKRKHDIQVGIAIPHPASATTEVK